MPPPHAKVDLLTLKVMSESRVTWAISVLILVFLIFSLSVLDLGPMYATDRQPSDAHHRLMPPPYGGRCIINNAQCHNFHNVTDFFPVTNTTYLKQLVTDCSCLSCNKS